MYPCRMIAIIQPEEINAPGKRTPGKKKEDDKKIKLLLSAVGKTQKGQSNFSALRMLWQQLYS